MLYLQKNQQTLEDEIDMLKGKDMSPKQYYQLRFKRMMQRRRQEVQGMYLLVLLSIVYLGFIMWFLDRFFMTIEAIIPLLLGLLSMVIGVSWVYFKNFPRDAFIAKAKRQIAAEYRALHQTP